MARKKSEADAGAKKINTAEERNATTVSIFLNGKNTDVKIKYNLSLGESLAFVAEIFEACFDDERGDYLPEAYAFAKRACLLTYYTNIQTPEDTYKMYEFVYSEEVEAALEIISFYYNKNQYNDLMDIVNKKIEHKKAVIVSTSTRYIIELLNKINEISSANEELFNNLTPEEVSSFVGSVSKMGEIDEGKLAEAVLDAQGRSV